MHAVRGSRTDGDFQGWHAERGQCLGAGWQSRLRGGVELLLALWVALRSKERVALWAVVLIAGGGVATTWLSPNRAGCGCLGTLVRMSESQHLMLASGLGLLASLGLATSQDISIRQQ